MSGQWIWHDPQVLADSRQRASQTGQLSRPHQELHLVDDMCLRYVVRVRRDDFSSGTKYRVLLYPGTCPFIDQTFLGYILVPICCEALGPELLVQSQSPILQPTSRMPCCFFAAPQWDFMLHAADRGPRPGKGRPRRLTSGTLLQKREMSPRL